MADFLSVCLSVCLSIGLSVCLSVYINVSLASTVPYDSSLNLGSIFVSAITRSPTTTTEPNELCDGSMTLGLHSSKCIFGRTSRCCSG